MLRGALLEGVEAAFGVSFRRGFLSEETTEVDEVFLGRGTLLEFRSGPLLNEVLRRHR